MEMGKNGKYLLKDKLQHLIYLEVSVENIQSTCSH